MTRWLAPVVVSLALGLMGLIYPIPAADVPKVSPRTDALDLLFLGNRPARLELRVKIDGESVPVVWDRTFARMLAFYDRNGDSVLDKTEAGRLPSEFALRQVLWGMFIPHSGFAPTFVDLDLNGDGKVSGEELADYYRRAGLGGVLIGVGKPAATEQLTDSLLQHLDVNKDVKVDKAEWQAASKSLRKLDKNDDELIGPGELVENTIYPGATGAILCSPPSQRAKLDPTTDTIPFIVLPLRTGDTYWVSAVAERLEKLKINQDGILTLRRGSPATAWNVNLGKRTKDTPQLHGASEKPPADARLRTSSGGVRVVLRVDEGKLKEQSSAARKQFQRLFAECDTSSDGILDDKELSTPRAAPFKLLATTADRDSDGKLSEKEVTDWLDLQQQIAKGHVLLTVLDHGRGLFECLDADHDGSLSVRELCSAWQRVQETGCVTEKGFDRTRLPRHLLATVSHGRPLLAIDKPTRTGPAWFLAMDRNGDGDVSVKEWVGDLDVFHKLDRDGDGLLSVSEAEKVPMSK